MKPEILITSARIDGANGEPAAYVEWIPVGGGTQTVTVDGVAEERIHPSSSVYHVRMISPDRTIPDQLRDADTYDQACKLAIKYVEKFNEHAERVASLADDLKV